MSKSPADKYYILHGCPPTEALVTPKENRWMNWLEAQLLRIGLDALAPDLPVSWKPKYVDWKAAFEQYPITENTVVIAHSCGAAFIVRFLSETKRKIKKLILVAPAKVPEGEDDTRADLYDFELSPSTASLADEVVIFISNDFPHHMKSFELYKQALNPRVVELEGKGHFLFFQMKTNEFPELLEEVMRVAP